MEHFISKDRSYSKTHEWCLTVDKKCLVGITDYAQHELGDIVLVDYKVTIGQEVKAGDVIATIEAVKTVSDIYAPVSGKVLEFNKKVQDDPAIINQDAYGEGWILSLEVKDPSECEKLMQANDYEDYITAHS